MSKLHISDRYGVAPNEVINDPNLSLKAKGLFLYIQSKPENWDFSAERIATQTKDGVDSIYSGLQELEEYGLLERIKKQDESGKWDWDYILHATIPGFSRDGFSRHGFSMPGKPRDNSNKDIVNKNSNKDIVIGCIPVSGNTPLARLRTFYVGLYKHHVGVEPRVMLNGKDGGVLKSLLKDYTEVQIAALMVNHFEWYGPSGRDDRAHERIESAAYPISWLTRAVNEYVVFMTNEEGLDFTNAKDVFKYVKDYLVGEKVTIG